MIDFEVFQIQQQNRRDGFDDNFLVTIDVDAQFSRLRNSHSVNQSIYVSFKNEFELFFHKICGQRI